MSKKLLFAIVGLVAVLAVGTVWLARDVQVTGMWALWFGGLAGVIGIYTEGNVRQSRIVSEHYKPELDSRYQRGTVETRLVDPQATASTATTIEEELKDFSPQAREQILRGAGQRATVER